MPTTPVTFTSELTYVGIAPEWTQQGAATLPVNTIVLTKDPSAKDNQIRLEDLGLRNSMAEVYGAVDGPLSSDLQLDGDVRADSIGYLLGNILGDWTQSSTVTSTSTTTAGSNPAGQAQINVTLITGFTLGNTVQVGTGATAEVFTIGTPTTGVLPIVKSAISAAAGVLAYAHAPAQPVVAIAGPFTYKFALANAGISQANPPTQIAQAHSLSITDWSGVTATSGARIYPGQMVSDLTFTLDATKLFTFTAKTMGWGSVPAGSTPVVTTTALPVQAGWTGAVGLGGPATGGTLLTNVETLSISLTRKVKIVPALGAKNPFIVKQGTFSVTAKFTIIALDESALTAYLANTQPQLQILLTSGSGATLQTIQFDLAQCYYKSSVINRSSEEVTFQVDVTGIANSTNVGGTGGLSPLTVSVTNNVPVGTY